MPVVPAAVLLMAPLAGSAQTVVPLGSFRSVALRNGGAVILRYGASQRVTLPEGAADCLSATIVDGDRLVITRQPHCTRGRHAAVEVETPEVDGIIVMDGGTIETRGSFPPQPKLRVAVDQGGTIDLRALSVARVTATVRQGGRILTRPQEALDAEIASGGVVTYWGRPHVRSSIQQGGEVYRGATDDADKSLDELRYEDAVVPPAPPAPPVPLAPPAPPASFRRSRSAI
jgi:hypothetical protein